jgi:hypothetical protein
MTNMRAKPAFAVSFALTMLLSVILPATESHASTESATFGKDDAVIARRDPPELSGCNSRCRRVYCAESGTNRTYLCRCDCPK